MASLHGKSPFPGARVPESQLDSRGRYKGGIRANGNNIGKTSCFLYGRGTARRYPGSVVYDCLCTRIDLLESKIYSDVAVRRTRHFGVIQKFPLAARLSNTRSLS
jgi:hypothetical protein